MSLKEMTTASIEGTTSHVVIRWQNNSAYVELPLTNYKKVATVNVDGTFKSLEDHAQLPCGKVSGEKSNFTKENNGWYYYNSESDLAPSPFNSDGSLNPIYATEGQALADVNGYSNTDVILTADNAKYLAAKTCRDFAPGTHDGEWYLPAVGELGYVMVQWKAIDDAIKAVGSNGVQLVNDNLYWSSTEWSNRRVYYLDTITGNVSYSLKSSNGYVRAFLML